MWQKITQSKFRGAWAALMIIAVLAISLSFAQVRAVANTFLGLFRVEKIEAVSIGIDLADLPAELEPSFTALDAILGEDMFIESIGEPYQLENSGEAHSLVNFPVRYPDELESEPILLYQPASTVGLTIDQARWQAIIDGLGYDFSIPEAVDGETITFNVPDTILAAYGNCNINAAMEVEAADSRINCTVLMQSATPFIEAPPGLDINLAGQIVLQTLGMSAEDADAFSAQINWSTTLVVPVPRDASYRDVNVDGVDGILLNDMYSNGPPVYTLLWVKNGVFYALTGPGTAGQAIELANSLK